MGALKEAVPRVWRAAGVSLMTPSAAPTLAYPSSQYSPGWNILAPIEKLPQTACGSCC